jgi:hypothetical protein
MDATIEVAEEDLADGVATNLDEAAAEAVAVVHKFLGLDEAQKANKAPAAKATEETEELTPAQKAARTRAANKAAKGAAEVEDEIPMDDDEEVIIDAPVEDVVEDDFDEITDADLQTAINAKVKLLRAEAHPEAVKVVKASIAAFSDGSANFTAGSMTQAQRRKFISKLEAIKGPGKEAA